MDTVKRFINMTVDRRFGQSWIDRAVLIAAYLMPFCGVIDQRLFTVIAILYLPVIAYTVFSDGLPLLYPIFFFFYGQLVLPLGIVVFRLYTLAFILRFIAVCVIKVIRGERLRFSVSKAVLAGLLFLTALRYMIFGGFAPLGAVIDLFFLLCFAMDISGEGDGVRRFDAMAVAFVFAALVSCTVGIFVAEEGRYLATLNDPNYLGFYLNIAILTVFLHPFFGKAWMKLPALGILYMALVASESITGVICNCAVVAFCIFVSVLSGRFKLRYVLIPLVFAIVSLQLIYISHLHSWGIVSEVSARVTEKLQSLITGDLSGFTTMRSAIWRINLEKLIGGGVTDILFGGSLVSAVGRDSVAFPQTSHQEFIDVLISVGAVGLTIYIAAFVFTCAEDVSKLRRSVGKEKNAAWIRIGIKLIWVFYALGLTMFLNGRFFIPLFI